MLHKLFNHFYGAFAHVDLIFMDSAWSDGFHDEDDVFNVTTMKQIMHVQVS